MLRRLRVLFFLLLLAASVSLWLRSHWGSDRLYVGKMMFMLDSDALYISYHPSWENDLGHLSAPAGWGIWEEEIGTPVQRFKPIRLLAFADATIVVIPFWFVILLLVPIIALLLKRGRANPRIGLCTQCGYDLRATPERCPECGTVPVGVRTDDEPPQ
jgi:hypothetical protein